MDLQAVYELVADAIRQGFIDEASGGDVALHRRLVEGSVVFRDNEGKLVKEIPVPVFFRKVTSVREKLRVLEQKINNDEALSEDARAEYQVYITRCYGSLTTFNFLFRDDEDKFKGTGGKD